MHSTLNSIQKISFQIDTKDDGDILGCFGYFYVFAENIWKPIFRMSTETTKWEEELAPKFLEFFWQTRFSVQMLHHP